MSNEKTSKKIASLTARTIARIKDLPAKAIIVAEWGINTRVCTVGELRSMLMSNLTQTADKKPKIPSVKEVETELKRRGKK